MYFLQSRSIRILLVSMAFTAPLPCYANFDYVPPGQQAPAAQAAPAPALEAEPMQEPSAPVHHRKHKAKAATKAVVAQPFDTAQNSEDGAVVEGFGTQVPLVIALKQIVPPSYQFSYGNNVTLGTLIDWKGGKPWRTVLRTVLAPLGLTANEKETVIYIDHSGG